MCLPNALLQVAAAQKPFKPILKNHLIGTISHGREVAVYIDPGLYTKGSNCTLSVIVDQLYRVS